MLRFSINTLTQTQGYMHSTIKIRHVKGVEYTRFVWKEQKERKKSCATRFKVMGAGTHT